MIRIESNSKSVIKMQKNNRAIIEQFFLQKIQQEFSSNISSMDSYCRTIASTLPSNIEDLPHDAEFEVRNIN